MTIKTVMTCDGRGCFNERDFYTTNLCSDDVVAAGWSLDADNEFQYCPSCKKKMIASGELEEGL